MMTGGTPISGNLHLLELLLQLVIMLYIFSQMSEILRPKCSQKLYTIIYIGNVLTMFLGLGMACGGLTFGSNGFFGIPKFRKLPCCMTMATMATYGNHKPPKDVWFDAVTAN